MTPEERRHYLDRLDTGDGWQEIIENLDRELAKIDPNYTIDQIKEKFGGLRYYYTPSFLQHSKTPPFFQYRKHHRLVDWLLHRRYKSRGNRMYELRQVAERASYFTCEICGSTEGVLNKSPKNQYWVKTLCASCWEKR